MRRKLNGHELESRYIGYVTELTRDKNRWLFPVLMKLKFFRTDHEFMISECTKRLDQLNKDRKDGFLQKRVYIIWKSMLENAIK